MITEHDFLNISGTQSDAYDFKQARLGIIGGSGLYRIENLKNIVELSLDTPYGKPSNKLLIGNLFGIEIVFLARHGEKHTLNPSEIPYKANIWAMRSLNVRWLISASAVGSLQENIKPRDIVIPDQFIDRTHQRPLTFFNNGVVAHISMANPFCANLSQILSKEIEKLLTKDKKIHIGGTYLAMEGPAFSTRAESNLYRDWGCSIIGMTNHTEARLAKEAEIAYSSLSMVTDYDCWNQNCENVSVEMVIENLQENATFAKSMASTGAFIAADKEIIDFMKYNMRSQMFAKSLQMQLVKGALKRLELLRTRPDFKAKLWENVNALQEGLKYRGFDLGTTQSCVTPVYLKGSIPEAMALVKDLRENHGIFCSIVVYPVIPKGLILLRLIPTAAHTMDDINETLDSFLAIRDKLENGHYKKISQRITA